MNREINKIITNLENCFGIFDYSLTPTESNLLVSYIKELQQENKQLKEIIDKAVLELVNIDDNLSNSQLSDRICNLIDILKEV